MIAKFHIKDQHWVEIKWLMKSSRIKYHNIKCGSDLEACKRTQCIWITWLVNLRNFSATDTFYDCFHKFAPGIVAYFIIHTICYCIIAAGHITHRTTPISNWNLFYSVQESIVTSQTFFKSVILSISDSMPGEGRDPL